MRALFDLFILLLGGERFPDSIIIIVLGRSLSSAESSMTGKLYDYCRLVDYWRFLPLVRSARVDE